MLKTGPIGNPGFSKLGDLPIRDFPLKRMSR
jgi:hypothetical protein